MYSELKEANPKHYPTRGFWYARDDFLAYKKCRTKAGNEGVVVTLMISKGTKFYRNIGFWAFNKCRAEWAIVVDTKKKSAHSSWDWDFTYKKGDVVRPRCRFNNQKRECESGIHFFLTYKEARDYPT